ncbi:MAG: SulP family inorganic anion transporter, partial [Alphaproteobacteria bacterium]|nr:SulP family inorganic anion transporter [Alphaproteobacteria bacterium]
MHEAGNQHRAGIGAALAAGAEGALETMPFLVVAGLIAFAPMGEAMSGIGIVAAFVSAILAGLWTLGFADRRGLIGGPSLGLALMIGAVLQTLLQRQLMGTADIGTALALSMTLTVAAGLLMAVVAVCGIGRLAALMPYPVLSGLRNGTALLLILEQAHAAMGMAEAHDGGFHFAEIHPGAVVVTVVTVVAMFVRLRVLRAVPPILRALVAGMVTHHVLAVLPDMTGSVGPLMAMARPEPVLLRDLGAGFAALPRLPFAVLSETLLPTLLSMVFLGLLETVAAASALHNETGQRGSGRRDLLAVALANLTGGLVGALPAAGSLEETLIVAHAPLRQARRTALLRCMVLLLLALLALPLLSRMPGAVLAGIIIATALDVSDIRALRQMLFAARSGRSHRVEGIGNLLIVITV